MNEQEVRHFIIKMAKMGAASAAKAQIIRNDPETWQKSNFIGKDAAEAYEEQARYAAHLFGDCDKMLREMFGTASPREISKMECPPTQRMIEWFQWSEKIREEELVATAEQETE